MKTTIFFTKTKQILFVILTLGLFSISCSKETSELDVKEINLTEKGGTFNFFNTYAQDFENLFDPAIWELMNSDPLAAMQELTGADIKIPFIEDAIWVPYITSNQTEFLLSAIEKNGSVIGVNATTSGNGSMLIDQIGAYPVDEEIDQFNLFSGLVSGETNIESFQMATQFFGIYYDIISSLDSPKTETGLVDAVLLNVGHSGILSDALGGFAIRKSTEPFLIDPQNPNLPQTGTGQTVTLGYFIFID
jgi:hypothetical protein